MVRNILAVIAGWIAGGIVNFSIILINPMIIPQPPGVDTSTLEGVAAAMPLFEPKHFIFPFLAHALGALAGGLVAALIAKTHKMLVGMIVGGLFLLGGLYMSWLIPAPLWFEVLDVLAYLPAAWIVHG